MEGRVKGEEKLQVGKEDVDVVVGVCEGAKGSGGVKKGVEEYWGVAIVFPE